MCPVITLLSTVDYCILFRQHGCAMFRAVSRQPLIAEAHALSQASSGGFLETDWYFKRFSSDKYGFRMSV